MKLLLDTHVLIWFDTGSKKLGKRAQRLLEEGELWVSAISAHELSKLVTMQRLQPASNIQAWLEGLKMRMGFEWLDLDVAQAIESYQLPDFEHADPCDRMIVAATRLSQCVLLSGDSKMVEYAHVNVMDATR